MTRPAASHGTAIQSQWAAQGDLSCTACFDLHIKTFRKLSQHKHFFLLRQFLAGLRSDLTQVRWYQHKGAVRTRGQEGWQEHPFWQ